MEAVYRSVIGLGRLALSALGIDVRWSGIEHLPTTGPVILAANHVSFPDFVFVERAALTRGRYVRFMCRHDVWNRAVIGFAMDRMGHIPVDRQTSVDAYLRARALLRAGEAVCLFPEAGISYSYTVRPMMRGAVALGRETGVPVVPVVVWGSQRIFSVGDPPRRPDLTRGRRVDLAFGAPMYVDPGSDLAAGTQVLGRTLTTMLESLQRSPVHQPRPGERAPWHPAHLGGHAMTRRRARDFDVVPRSAVTPTWGPDLDAFAD